MSLVKLEQFFLWCTVINYALLLFWWVMLLLPHAWIYNLAGKRFGVTAHAFDAANLVGIGLYKIAIVFFNLIPAIVLAILR